MTRESFSSSFFSKSHRMKPQMQWSYLFKHWFATLLIAPFLTDLFLYIDPNNHKIGGFVEVYPIVLLMSFIFSLPTYIIYAAAFYLFWLEEVPINVAKIILVLISTIGILVTFMAIGLLEEKTFLLILPLSYMLTSLLTGIFFQLEKELNTES